MSSSFFGFLFKIYTSLQAFCDSFILSLDTSLIDLVRHYVDQFNSPLLDGFLNFLTVTNAPLNWSIFELVFGSLLMFVIIFLFVKFLIFIL